jgi:hypothetical protein
VPFAINGSTIEVHADWDERLALGILDELVIKIAVALSRVGLPKLVVGRPVHRKGIVWIDDKVLRDHAIRIL